MNHSPLLAATALANDPRVDEAKRLLLEAVEEQSKKIQGIRPPNAALKTSYQDLISAFNELRGGKLWFPYVGSGIGNGALVELMDGSVKYDCICGIGPHFWGHSNPLAVIAGVDAAISNTVMQGNLQQNEDSFRLSKLLVERSGLDHCFLSTSGAMANENALKLAFHKRTPAARILAFDKCFVGRSLVESQVTDKPAFREGLPMNYHVDYVPFYDHLHPDESTQLAVSVLRKHLGRYPKQHAVMIFELVQGEGGFHPGTSDFFRAIMQILKEHHVTVFVDEVQTFGRTTELFAYQHFGLEEFVDVASIGKLSQVCATLFRASHKPQAGLLSQTFTGSTSSIRAGIALIEDLIHGGYYGPQGRIQKLHLHFTQKLREIANKYPQLIQGPFGIGCMIACTPYDGDTHRSTQFVHDLFEAGVIAFVAGSNPTRVRFLLPAGAIRFEDLDCIAAIVEDVLVKGGR